MVAMAKGKPMTLTMNNREYVLVPVEEYRQMRAAIPKPAATGLDLLFGGTRESVAHSIRTRRVALGLTQVDLAKLASVRNETISRIEKQQVAADMTTVNALDLALKRAEIAKKKGGK